MTADEKLSSIHGQINACEMGITKIIECPYCMTRLDFSPPKILDEKWQPPTCCPSFAYAVIAILQRKEMIDARDMADRIADKVNRAVFN